MNCSGARKSSGDDELLSGARKSSGDDELLLSIII
jgi:hypothetical protein